MVYRGWCIEIATISDRIPENRRAASAGPRARIHSDRNQPENGIVQPSPVHLRTNTAQAAPSRLCRRGDTMSGPRLCPLYLSDSARLESQNLSWAACLSLNLEPNLTFFVNAFQPDFPPVHQLTARAIPHFSVAE